MGYMLFGVGMSTQLSMGATIYYVAHHIVVQSTLFLAAGLIETRAGTTNLARLGGLAKIAPVIAILFFVPAMNLAGIPPLSGFLGKVGLIQAGIEKDTAGSWILIVASVVTSLLTLYVIAKIWNRAFWQEAPEQVAKQDVPMPRIMLASTGALVALSLVLTIFAGPFLRYTEAAASAVLERSPYVEAVLGTGASDELVNHIDDDGERVRTP
jgi:multicomponent Na+:H+ antiporter subunit D